MFYVYVYLDPRRSGKYTYKNVSFLFEPFYIGKGKNKRYLDHITQVDRKKKSYFREKLLKILSEYSKQELKKYILILRDGLSEEAFELEKELIKSIGRADLELGCLTNHTDGGEGTRGGRGSKGARWRQSGDAKQKISIANKGKPKTEAHKRKLSIFHTGRKHTEESLAKMSEIKKGEKSPWFGKHRTEEEKRKISQTLRGRKHTKETCKKNSEAHKGKKHSEQSKIKMSEARKGKEYTEEHRKNLSQARRGKCIGETNPNSVLTVKKVHQVHMLLNLNFSNKDISKIYHITPENVKHIEMGRTWKNVYNCFKLQEKIINDTF